VILGGMKKNEKRKTKTQRPAAEDGI